MKTTQIILRLALLAGLTACVDLKEKLVGTVTTQFYATPAGLEAAVNAAYQNSQGFWSQYSAWVLGDFGTDLWTQGDQGGEKYWNNYGSQLNPSDGQVSGPWQTMYRGINIDNAIIERAPGVTGMDTTVRNQRIAEARFLRALNYFYIVQLWGDAHLSLSESQGVVTAAHRTPADSIYLAIIQDLKDAAAVLPATQAQFGRVTKGAAWHLLSKVYLTRAYQTKTVFSASFAREPGETPATDFDRARAYADSVINSGRYALLANYADLFCVARTADPLRTGYCDNTGLNEANSEVIFSIQHTYVTSQFTAGQGMYLHLVYLSYYDDRQGMTRDLNNGRAFRRLRPTAFALNLWQRWVDTTTHAVVLDTRYNGTFQSVWIANNPARLAGYTASACPSGFGGVNCTSGAAFVVGDTAMWHPGYDVGLAFRQAHKYWIIEPCLTETVAAPCPATSTFNRYDELRFPTNKKYEDNLRQDFNTQDGGKDNVLMRLGETYLIAAEAALGQGDQAGALGYINVVRERARFKGAGAAPSMAMAGPVTIDSILNERGRELMGESNRWYDLARTGRWSRITQYNMQAQAFNITKHTLRPIPQNQIDRTIPAGSFPQNPGY